MSEAAPLADVFVFRLMFRLYTLPKTFIDEPSSASCSINNSAAFYEKKRLLTIFAARKYRVKIRHVGKVVDADRYLMISALTLDTRNGACSALDGTACGIYERRPASCRSVPFHYARGEAAADQGFAAFVQTPGYRCDTGPSAEVVLEDGRIVSPRVKAARADAARIADGDAAWRLAIARRMRGAPPERDGLPTIQQVETNAQFGVSTVSMSGAWRVAHAIGLISRSEYCELIERQLSAIRRELSAGQSPDTARQTLLEMAFEYEAIVTGNRQGDQEGGRS